MIRLIRIQQHQNLIKLLGPNLRPPKLLTQKLINQHFLLIRTLLHFSFQHSKTLPEMSMPLGHLISIPHIIIL